MKTDWRSPRLRAGLLGKGIACLVAMLIFYWAGYAISLKRDGDEFVPAELARGSAAGVPHSATPHSLPLRISGGPDSGRFGVPKSALKGLVFLRFDDRLNVTPEARAILLIDDEAADRLREVALTFQSKFRASQAERVRKGSVHKWVTVEVAPASDAEASAMRGEFEQAISAVVGEETARHIPFPFHIRTGIDFQIFRVGGADENGVIKIDEGSARYEDGVCYSVGLSEAFHLEANEPVPEKWRHLFALEEGQAQ